MQLHGDTVARFIQNCEAVGVKLDITKDKKLQSLGAPLPISLRPIVAAHRDEIIAAITLRNRLDAGHVKMERERIEGRLSPDHEDFWIELLDQYVAAMDIEISV